jgi:hypothetical protein
MKTEKATSQVRKHLQQCVETHMHNLDDSEHCRSRHDQKHAHVRAAAHTQGKQHDSSTAPLAAAAEWKSC